MIIVQVLVLLFAIKNILGDVPEILIPLDERDMPPIVKFDKGKWKLVADGTTTLEGYFIFASGVTQISMEMDYPGKWPQINKEESTLLEMIIDGQDVNFIVTKVFSQHQIHLVHNETKKLLYGGENKKFHFVFDLDGTVGVKNEKQINLVGGLNPIITKDGKKAVKFSLTVKNAPATFSINFNSGEVGFVSIFATNPPVSRIEIYVLIGTLIAGGGLGILFGAIWFVHKKKKENQMKIEPKKKPEPMTKPIVAQK